ncbi:hypothetical protein [Paenibacillus aquistagni]|uniref:Uncharacterized protein n=1 Tax=Paenibacillus aquistagni TaxID=1852522 RepID=A0A1X7LWM0_9BACL|nr:hypothetical protein [Paenibacillus aquistagni]SMG58278.1 hypothetical protein SAMN06295960_4661 [Paenibacillus aquistagni]
MTVDKLVRKSELVKLLDTSDEFEKAVYDNFSGDEYSDSQEFMNISGIKNIYDLLIPTKKWTKEDFTKESRAISIAGAELDEDGNSQLIISLDDVKDAFITTSDAVNQLFAPVKMSNYAKFLIEDQDHEHFPMLLSNFDYWFKGINAEEMVLVRTVIEDGKRIVRCFATPSYRPIDNHVLLYIALWALEQLDVKFRLALARIDHSSMKLDFVSEEDIVLKGIGKLSYGFTLVNSESKEKTVGFHPTFELTNSDNTSATLIMDKPISIVHRGKSMDPIIHKLTEINEIKSHLKWVVEVIKIAHTAKIDDIFAFKVQQAIIKIIGPKEFGQFASTFTAISSNNTINLLQFFGRLNEMKVADEDKAIKVKVLFWKFLEQYKKDIT